MVRASVAVSPRLETPLWCEEDAEMPAEHEDYLVTFNLQNDPHHIGVWGATNNNE